MKTAYIIKYFFIALVLLNANILYGDNFFSTSEDANEETGTKEVIDLQERKFYVGYSVGLNTMNLGVNTVGNIEDYGFENISPIRGFGFSIGLVSNLKLNNSLDLRFTPTLSFSSRGINYNLLDEHSTYHEQDLEVTSIEFPLLLKYTFTHGEKNNPYAIAGLNYAHDLASIELGVGDDILFRTKRNDLLGEIGFGLERNLTYFSFCIELKASVGFNNLITDGELDPRFYNTIESLRTRNISLSIIIE